MYLFKSSAFSILRNKKTTSWTAAISNFGMIGDWPEPLAIEKGFFDLIKDKQISAYSKWDSTTRVGVSKTPLRTFCSIIVHLLRDKLSRYNPNNESSAEGLFWETKAYVDQARLNKAFTSMKGVSIDYKNDTPLVRMQGETAMDLKILSRVITLLEQVYPIASTRYSLIEDEEGSDPTLTFLSSLVNAGVLGLVNLSIGQSSASLATYRAKTPAYLVYDLLTSETYEALIAPTPSQYDAFSKIVDTYKNAEDVNKKLDPPKKMDSATTSDYLTALFNMQLKDALPSYIASGAFPDGVVIIEIPAEIDINQNNYAQKLLCHTPSKRNMTLATFKLSLFSKDNVPYYLEEIDFSNYINKNELNIPQRYERELTFQLWLDSSKFRSLISNNARRQAALRSPLYSFSIITDTMDLTYSVGEFAINREFSLTVDYKIGNSKDHTEDEVILQKSASIDSFDIKERVRASLEHYNSYLEGYVKDVDLKTNRVADIKRDILNRFKHAVSSALIASRTDKNFKEAIEKERNVIDKMRCKNIKLVFQEERENKISHITVKGDENMLLGVIKQFVMTFSRNSMTSNGILFMLFGAANMSAHETEKGYFDIQSLTTEYELVFNDANELIKEYDKHTSDNGNRYLENAIAVMSMMLSDNLLDKLLHIISIDEVYGERQDRSLTMRTSENMMKPSINYVKWDRLNNNTDHLRK